MTAYLFVGPTVPPAERGALVDFICLPPASMGDVYRAAGFDLETRLIPGHSSGHVVFLSAGHAPAVVFGGVFAVKALMRAGQNQFFDNMPQPAVAVSSAVAQKQKWSASGEAVGTFVAVNGTEVTTEAGGVVREIEATLHRGPRVVRLDGVELDFDPLAHILLMRNEDKPGVIGLVGSHLGAAGVNIVNFSLGASGDDGAIAAITVDREVPEAQLASLRGIPGILAMEQV